MTNIFFEDKKVEEMDISRRGDNDDLVHMELKLRNGENISIGYFREEY